MEGPSALIRLAELPRNVLKDRECEREAGEGERTES